MDFGSYADNVKPTVVSWFIIGLMALSFIVAAKIVVAHINIPGLSEVVNAA